MPRRCCDHCGQPYEYKSARSRFCTDRCRAGHRKDPDHAPEPLPHAGVPGQDDALVESVRSALDEVDRLGTPMGRLAMNLTRRVASASETAAGTASLTRELRAVLADALGDASTSADPIDELRQRRDRKRAG